MGERDASNRAEHHIAPGVRGWLESPTPDAAVEDCLFVTGWAFSTGARVVAVRAEIAGERRHLRAGQRRDDVAAAYPQETAARDSGFSAYVEFERPAVSSLVLAIDADLEDGRTVRLFTRRLSRSGRLRSPLVKAVRDVVAHP